MRTVRYPSFPTAQRRRAGIGGVLCLLGSTIAFVLPPRAALLVALGFLVLAAGALARWNRYRRGERGENGVARAFRRLDGRYVLLRNWTPAGCQADVDLVLLGPHGALVVEAKSHASPVRCHRGRWEVRTRRGWRRMRDPVAQLRRNAERVSRRLRMPVQAVLVYNDRADLQIGDPGITVLRRRELRRFVRLLDDEGHDAERMAAILNET